jgi:hypothetical protein
VTYKKSWLTDPKALRKEPPLPVVVAIKAISQGTADEEQQRRFLAWLINDACNYGQSLTFFGSDAALKTYFAMGRHRVAEILKTYIETPIEKFKGSPSEQVT